MIVKYIPMTISSSKVLAAQGTPNVVQIPCLTNPGAVKDSTELLYFSNAVEEKLETEKATNPLTALHLGGQSQRLGGQPTQAKRQRTK